MAHAVFTCKPKAAPLPQLRVINYLFQVRYLVPEAPGLCLALLLFQLVCACTAVLHSDIFRLQLTPMNGHQAGLRFHYQLSMIQYHSTRQQVSEISPSRKM